MSTILVFENTEFDVVDIHNVAWLRGPQIGGALGYQDPADAIQKVFTRNADEFTAEMTQVLELPTAGGLQQVRVFSPRGCYLLGMLARTEKAKAFRQWVLDVLEGRAMPQANKPISVSQQITLHKLRTSLLRELLQCTSTGVRGAIHEQLRQVSRLLALPCPAIETIGRAVTQGELL